MSRGRGAVLASPLMPIGLARRAEPDPGIAVDGLVIAVGAVAVAVLVFGAAGVAAWWMTGRRVAARRTPGPSAAAARPRTLGRRTCRRQRSAPALDRRPPALPVRSAIVGVSVAILGTVGVLTAGEPRPAARRTRTLGLPVGPHVASSPLDDVDDATDALVDDDRLAMVAPRDAGFTYVDGEGTAWYGLRPLRGDAQFSLRSGRQPVMRTRLSSGQTPRSWSTFPSATPSRSCPIPVHHPQPFESWASGCSRRSTRATSPRRRSGSTARRSRNTLSRPTCSKRRRLSPVRPGHRS